MKKKIKKKKFNRSDYYAVKDIVKKAISVTRAALEMYIAVRKKDPIYVGLSLMSSVEAFENVIIKRGKSVYSELTDMGLVSVVPGMERMAYNILIEMGVPYNTLKMERTRNESNEKIIVFDLGEEKVYFILRDSNVLMMYVREEDKFVKSFSKTIQAKVGGILSLSVIRESYSTFLKLEPIEIPLKTYICHIDINEYVETVNKFRKMGINRSSLLYGPPGSGKTSYAAKVAEMLKGRLLVIDAQALNLACGSGWNNSIKKIVRIVSPSVILFDDIDRIYQDNLNMLLGMVENLNRYKSSGEIIIMASVNNIANLPDAMKRPGRFDEIMIFDFPSLEQRRDIIKIYLDDFGTRLADHYVEEMANLTEGLSPAYIKEIALRATVLPYDKIPKAIEEMKKMLNIGQEKKDDNSEESPNATGNGDGGARILKCAPVAVDELP